MFTSERLADIVGFYFMDQATGYRPSLELADFLEKGPPPVYIGWVYPYLSRSLFKLTALSNPQLRFGSVVVEDANKMTGRSRSYH